jgi:hypothetical protein
MLTEVGAHDPCELVEGIKVGCDAWEGSRDDGLVEGDEENGEEEAAVGDRWSEE